MIKKRARICASVSFALAILAIEAFPCAAQSLVSALPVEPPSSLFSAKLGDADVEAFAQGFWEASILSTGALSIGSADSGFNAVPFLFTQTPDLYTFLRYRQKWVFEAYVTQELKNAKFSLAFEGDDADFIKSARLGNADITMGAYPYMAFGSPEGSFGAALRAVDSDSGVSLDAMVRWDGLSWKTRTFFGGAEALESTLSPRDNLRGRRFVLGGTGVTGLVLVDTTATGSRVLNSDEYSASLAAGVVLLKAEPRGTLTASWSDGSSHDGIVLYSYSVEPNGTVTRTTTGYEVRNLYALPDTSSARKLFLRDLATGTTAIGYSVSRVAPGLVQVVKDDAVPFPVNDNFRLPFKADAPWIYDEPAADGSVSPAGDGYAIVAKVVESVESIQLEDATVAGTITVYRDGVESVAFDYDAEARTLTLSPPPRSGERVQVRYAVSSQDRSNGALAFGLGSRFPWLGFDWATAFGGRWPMFGSSYDEGGELKGAWLGLSAGVSKEAKSASFALDSQVRYQRAGASGLYRVAGMEDYSGSSNTLVPFRGVSGDFANIVVSTALDPDLGFAPAFSAIIDDLHSIGSGNRALVLTAISATVEATFTRYIDYAPLPTFRTLSFFVKADEIVGNPTMEVRVGNGLATGYKGASVTVAVDSLGAGWYKVELDLDPMAGVTVYRADGQAVSVGASGSYSAPDAAGLVEIIVSGLTSGNVAIDEIILENPRDGFSVLAGGSFFLGDKSKKAGAWLEARADGVVDARPVIAGSAEAGWTGKPASLAVSATPAWADGEGSIGVGYAVAVPGRSSPVRFVDEFSRDEVLGRYGRSLEAVLSTAGFSASAMARSAEDAQEFSQSWKAGLSYGNLASVTGTASLDAQAAPVAGMGIIDSWMESWRLALPVEEAKADSRRLELSAALLGSDLTASASRQWNVSSPAQTAFGATAFGAKATLPLRIGAVDFAPYYLRKSSVDRQDSAGSFAADAAGLADAVSSAGRLWSAAPLAELWNAEAFDGFGKFSEGSRSASHRAEIGLSARRPIGYGLVDLFVPSAVSAACARVVGLENDTLVESSVYSISLSGGAANVFASTGVLPRLSSVAFDEYSYRTSLDMTRYASDGSVLPKLASNCTVSFEGLSGSVVALTSSFNWQVTRTQTPWSEVLGVALNTRPKRTWLGDLVGVALDSRRKAAASRETPGSWVSEWFDAVTADPPALRESFAFDASVGRSGSGAEPLVVRNSLDWSSKATAQAALTVGLGAGLWQALSVGASSTVWSFGYRLSLEAKVVF
ncbi:MAG: hypothetical protein CVV51_11195 [Spirochaetae bacterium HGW-Spirochaetae-7]|nr:MAG: hypothetical protein CVV51_11195 [Spirochaetae bacterium HGW-Spirochaetae-7]